MHASSDLPSTKGYATIGEIGSSSEDLQAKEHHGISSIALRLHFLEVRALLDCNGIFYYHQKIIVHYAVSTIRLKVTQHFDFSPSSAAISL